MSRDLSLAEAVLILVLLAMSSAVATAQHDLLRQSSGNAPIRKNCEDWNTWAFFQVATASEVTTCLANGANVRARTRDGHTPLHMAAGLNSDPAVLRALLAADADMQARTNDGNTPLHYAAINKNPAVAEVLFLAGVDVMATNEAGYTAAHLAAQSQNTLVLQALTDAEAQFLNPIFDVTPFRDGNKLFLNPLSRYREGKEGSVFLEAQISGDVSLTGGRNVRFIASNINKKLNDNKYHFAGQAYATMLFRLRMLDAPSRPIRPVSFMPKFTYQHIGFRRDGTNRASMFLANFVVGHHSNGQSGCAFVVETDECPVFPSEVYGPVDINVQTGSFSTHYLRFGLYRSWIGLSGEERPREEVTIGGGVELHMPCVFESIGAICGELAARYGRNRIWFFHSITGYDYDSFDRLELRFHYQHIFGDQVQTWPALGFELFAYPRGKSDLGLYLRGSFGQDNYNINFEHIDARFELGLTFSWDNVVRVVPGSIF